MKRLLILGAEGFIGRGIEKYFEANGYTVFGLDKQKGSSKTKILDLTKEPIDGFLKDIRAEVVINASGSGLVYRSLTHRREDYDLNVGVVNNVLESIAKLKSNIKFVQISSGAVYGNAPIPIKEESPLVPESPYGEHKRMAEDLCKQYSEKTGRESLSLRVFSAYGAGLKRQIFWDLLQKLKADSKKLILKGTGEEARDYIEVSDLARAIHICLEKSKMTGQSLNVGSGEATLVSKAAQVFCEALGAKPEIKFDGISLPGAPLKWQADISKIKSMGFEPKMNLEQGLRQYVTWLRTIGEWT